ncbi:hypothetical protein [Geothrix terrae]|uniref:hypothetical protein n=1 Tax=Geothrix terrae TaxID=2922720 RepID=UPI001FAD868B|nr:hypothetical protein [Geothrix terrae]
MRRLICALLSIIGGLGCARIYRPVTLATPPASIRGEGLAGQVALQPWGDNSRYERKALQANLRVFVLTLENTSSVDLEILRLDLPEGATALLPAAATSLVKQRSLAYILYPLLPGLASLGAAEKPPSGSVGPSDQAILQGLVIVGACIGIPNALIAARSNRHLEAFFRDQAWSPGLLRAGQTRRGLVFLRAPDLYAPLPLLIIYRGSAGERNLALIGPGARPL